MNEAKTEIIDSLNEISDNVTDEFQVMDDLYKLLKLKRSRKAVQSEGTLTTEQVRQHFREKREGVSVQC